MDANEVLRDSLFAKFNISQAHDVWKQGDDALAVRLFTVVSLKNENDATQKGIYDAAVAFLTKVNNDGIVDWMYRSDYGVLYVIAKQIIFKHFKQ